MGSTVKDLRVYQKAFDVAVKIQELSNKFPQHEIYALTKQIRCSSRSVCSNLSEGYKKRIYPKHFRSKLSDADSEASETMTWLDFARAFGYIDEKDYEILYGEYEHISNMLGQMIKAPEKFAPVKVIGVTMAMLAAAAVFYALAH